MDSNDCPGHNGYRFMWEKRLDHLRISVTTEDPQFEMTRPVWVKIADVCSGSRCEKILIEVDIPKQLSIADLHWLRRELSKRGVTDSRVAVADPRRKRHAINRFAELASANKEIVVRAFTSTTAAAKWLSIDGQPPN